MIDWDELKALDAKAKITLDDKMYFELRLAQAFPAILAQHEQDQATIAALRQQQGEQIAYDGTQLADLLATSPESIQNRFEFADKTWSPWMTITVDEAGYCQYANVRHQLRGLYLPQQGEGIIDALEAESMRLFCGKKPDSDYSLGIERGIEKSIEIVRAMIAAKP